MHGDRVGPSVSVMGRGPKPGSGQVRTYDVRGATFGRWEGWVSFLEGCLHPRNRGMGGKGELGPVF